MKLKALIKTAHLVYPPDSLWLDVLRLELF